MLPHVFWLTSEVRETGGEKAKLLLEFFKRLEDSGCQTVDLARESLTGKPAGVSGYIHQAHLLNGLTGRSFCISANI